jgi:hypothetical protein
MQALAQTAQKVMEQISPSDLEQVALPPLSRPLTLLTAQLSRMPRCASAINTCHVSCVRVRCVVRSCRSFSTRSSSRLSAKWTPRTSFARSSRWAPQPAPAAGSAGSAGSAGCRACPRGVARAGCRRSVASSSEDKADMAQYGSVRMHDASVVVSSASCAA